MNTDMSRRQFVGLAGSLATVLGLGLVGCGGGAGKGSAAGSAAAKDVKGAAESITISILTPEAFRIKKVIPEAIVGKKPCNLYCFPK